MAGALFVANFQLYSTLQSPPLTVRLGLSSPSTNSHILLVISISARLLGDLLIFSLFGKRKAQRSA